MSQNKLSSRVSTLVKSAAAAAVLPVVFIYVMIAKPDYHLMNALSHVVVPVAHVVGDVLTWPLRVVGRTAVRIRDISTLRAENEELRAALDAAMRRQTLCDVALDENTRLMRELNQAAVMPTKTIVARLTQNNSAFGHHTFLIDRGKNHGVRPGMAVASFDGFLIGTVLDAGDAFARVRALTDTDSKIPVRVTGTEVYGFLSGDGSASPRLEFLSQPEFIPTAGVQVVTGSIGGVLPADLPVGKIADGRGNVSVPDATRDASVMILHFDAGDTYK
ncbi:rod shape-determining protein MreC [bacterium]|nr:rod shape-determining protein MreC [bacterium]